jgi:stage II sporulation protein D
MISRIVLFLLAFLPLSMSGQADILTQIKTLLGRPPQHPPAIKILIVQDQDEAVLEVVGKYKLFDPNTNSHISSRFLGKSKKIQAMADGLKWGEEFPCCHQLELVPTTAQTQFFVNGIEYKGTLRVYSVCGKISIVNEIPIEDYLCLTLESKYSKSLSSEALSAFAIAERTNAYFLANIPKRKFWSVDGTQSGYEGYYAVDPNSPIQKAIRNTRYMVMSRTGTYEGIVTPFPAQWSDSSKEIAKGFAKISVDEVEQMAQKGSHAALILEKAFPRTSIQLIY